MLASLRRTSPSERRTFKPPDGALCIPTQPWRCRQDIPSGVLPHGFSEVVAERVLELVNNFAEEPGLFVVLHLPEESGDRLQLDDKHADPGVSAAWREGAYSVFDDLPFEMLRTWNIGATVIHAQSGEVLDVGARILDVGVSHVFVKGGTKNNSALKCSIECGSVAITKKMKYYQDSKTPKLEVIRIYSPSYTQITGPDSPLQRLLQQRNLCKKDEQVKAAYFEYSCDTYRKSLPSSFSSSSGYLQSSPVLASSLRLAVIAENAAGPHTETTCEMSEPAREEQQPTERNINIQSEEPVNTEWCRSRRIDLDLFWQRAAVAEVPRQAEQVLSLAWETGDDLPLGLLPDGFASLVLMRALDLMAKLPDDALVVLGMPHQLPVDTFCSHPERAQEWRNRQLNIFQSLSQEALDEWCYDGAVVVHPSSGEVLEITVKLLQQRSSGWSLPGLPGGFKKDAALKVALSGVPCVALCLDGDAKTVLVCSSKFIWSDRPPLVWKLPCGGDRVQENTLKQVQDQLELAAFEDFALAAVQEGRCAPSVKQATMDGESSTKDATDTAMMDLGMSDDQYAQGEDLKQWRAAEVLDRWERIQEALQSDRYEECIELLHRSSFSLEFFSWLDFTSDHDRRNWLSERMLTVLTHACTGYTELQEQLTLALHAASEQVSSVIDRQSSSAQRHELTTTLENLGSAYGRLGDAERQRQLLERALAIKEREYGPDHREVAITFANLGIAYGKLGDAERQRQLLERALAINEREYGPDHREVAITRTILGRAYGRLGDAERQRQLLERALAIDESEYGRDHREVAITLTNLGIAYGELGDAERRRQLLERALAITEHEYGPDHREVANILTHWQTGFGRTGDAERQRQLLERALAINEREYGPDHREVALTLTNLGRAYGQLGDAERQRQLLERALSINEREYGPDHREVAITLLKLGSAYAKLGDAERQRQLLERALAIKEREYGPDHREVAITLTNLGSAYGKLGDAERHRQLLKRALAIKERLYGQDQRKGGGYPAPGTFQETTRLGNAEESGRQASGSNTMSTVLAAPEDLETATGNDEVPEKQEQELNLTPPGHDPEKFRHLVSDDGNLVICIPIGCSTAQEQFSVHRERPQQGLPHGCVHMRSEVYRLQPEGIQFDAIVWVGLKVDRNSSGVRVLRKIGPDAEWEIPTLQCKEAGWAWAGLSSFCWIFWSCCYPFLSVVITAADNAVTVEVRLHSSWEDRIGTRNPVGPVFASLEDGNLYDVTVKLGEVENTASFRWMCGSFATTLVSFRQGLSTADMIDIDIGNRRESQRERVLSSVSAVTFLTRTETAEIQHSFDVRAPVGHSETPGFAADGAPVWHNAWNQGIKLPDKCSVEVVNSTLRLASKVATKGLGEKTPANGFLIIVGDACKLKDKDGTLGTLPKYNKFEDISVGMLDIHDDAAAMTFVLPCFCQDKAMIVCGESGRILSDFFAISNISGGDDSQGTGHQAASAIAQHGVFAIKCSEDSCSVDGRAKGVFKIFPGTRQCLEVRVKL